MMRRISFIVFCLSLLFGCGEQQKFIVLGEVDGMEGDTLFLAARNIEGQWDTLGVAVVGSGIFRFEGSVPRPLIAIKTSGVAFVFGESIFSYLFE